MIFKPLGKPTKRRAFRALMVIEKAVVLIAALAALVPLWQYYSEAQDRRIDRAANFILAYTNCSEVWLADFDRAAKRIAALMEQSNPRSSLEDFIDIDEYIAEFEKANEISTTKWTQTITDECDYISLLNDPDMTPFDKASMRTSQFDPSEITRLKSGSLKEILESLDNDIPP